MVFSPGAPLVAEASRLQRLHGEVFLVAPSAGHVNGIAPWRAEAPSTTVVAASVTARRIEDVPESSTPESARGLPEGVTLHRPPVEALGEVWMRVEDGGRVYWIVCDAFSNIERLAAGFWLRLAQRLYGLRVGLAVGAAFRRKTNNGAALLAWMQQTFEEGCDVLVPCHGEVDAAPRLAERLVERTRSAFNL